MQTTRKLNSVHIARIYSLPHTHTHAHTLTFTLTLLSHEATLARVGKLDRVRRSLGITVNIEENQRVRRCRRPRSRKYRVCVHARCVLGVVCELNCGAFPFNSACTFESIYIIIIVSLVWYAADWDASSAVVVVIITIQRERKIYRYN